MPYEEPRTVRPWGSATEPGEPRPGSVLERRLDVARWVFTAVVVAVVALSATVVVGRIDQPSASGKATAGKAAPAPDDHVTVLRDWDRARAEAWADGDPEALAELYTPRSRAGREDVRRLKAWTERGWTVHGVAPQLIDVRAEQSTPDELVVLVVDRLVAATAHQDGERIRIPDGAERTRRLTLRRGGAGGDGGRWRVATVVDVPVADPSAG